jgi:hypothetical protein
MKIDIEQIARICHEANRVYCAELMSDDSQSNWDNAPDWHRESVIAGVRHIIENPDATPADSHNSWLAAKRAEGWIWDVVKDPVKKTHPCMMRYESLPLAQKFKDYLFGAIVRACIQDKAV